MPQLIPVAIGYAATALAGAAGLGTVGATLGITALNSITWASVIGTAVGIGSSFALSAAMGGGGGRAEQAAQDRKHMVRGTAEPRQVIYGTARVSGSLVYAGSSGPNKAFLHLVLPVATHRCKSIGIVWLNGMAILPSQLDANGNLTDTAHPMHGRVRIQRVLGNHTAPPADLIAESPDGHTVNHAIFGACYLYIRLQYDPERMPNIPNVECLVEGRDDIWDPRSNTTGFSNNWALCILHYLRWEYGLNTPLDLIDQANFIAQANLSDELVQISAGGEQQIRYLLDGAFKLSEDTLPVDVLQRMLDAGAGRLYRVAGRFRLYGGAYRAPTGTISASDLTGKVQIVPRHSRSQLFNGVKVTFIDPARDWGAHPGSPVTDPAMVAEDGGFQLWRELDLPFVTNRTHAERIARIKLLEHRDGLTVHAPVKFSSIRFCLGQYISFSDPRAGMDGKVFEVMDWKFDPNGMGVILVLEERAAFNYAWQWDLAYSGAPAPNTTLVNPLAVPTPAAPSLAQVLTINGDGQSVPAIAATWTPPAFPFLTGMDVEFRRAGGQWQSQFVPAGTNRLEVWPLISGITYEFRLRARGQFVPSSASTSASITAPGDTLAPSMPTGLVATPAPGGGALAWNMNSDADLDRYRVWERPGPTDAWTLIAETYSNRYLRTNLPAGTTRRYAVSAVDLSGNEGLRCSDAVLIAGSLPTTDLSGQITTPQLQDLAVETGKIGDNAVTTLAAGSFPGGSATAGGLLFFADFFPVLPAARDCSIFMQWRYGLLGSGPLPEVRLYANGSHVNTYIPVANDDNGQMITVMSLPGGTNTLRIATFGGTSPDTIFLTDIRFVLLSRAK